MQSKTILVGSDETQTLSALIESLSNHHNYRIITAVRISDLISIIRSINPSFIVLSFRNNQSVINSICTFLKTSKIPILCLTKNSYGENIDWTLSNPIFINTLNNALKSNYLANWFNSILLLMKDSYNDTGYEPLTSNTNHYKSLSRYTLEIDQKQAMLNKIKFELEHTYKDVNERVRLRLKTIVNEIKTTSSDKRHWEDFKIYFENINPSFLKNLSVKHPNLTSKDLKYCCYLSMNMSNNDIKNLLCINAESVRTHKYRLKKKMRLSKDQDLITYTRALGRRLA
ncbi:MAG: hypothetical protein EVB11_03205 [Winogradskyella sp.]|nr:MAG: hypothetical protein EVB11_03205 [Winogradskyella sp.]